MNNNLYCGAAKENITPNPELLTRIRGMLNKSFGKVFDEIFVRVIALGNPAANMLLISFDMGKAANPDKNIKLITEITGIPKENILYACTHTHTAPGDRGPVKLMQADPTFTAEIAAAADAAEKEYDILVTEKLLAAVKRAISDMQPAKMGYGFGKSFINVNRCQDYIYRDENGKESIQCGLGANSERIADPTLFVMRFTDMDGKEIAFFVNYAVHCALMIWNNAGEGKLGLSGDIAGNVSGYIEQEYEGSVAMWVSGAAGDINPIMMNQTYYPDPVTGQSRLYPIPKAETALMMLKTLSARHYADILKTIKEISGDTSDVMLGAASEIASSPKCIWEYNRDGKHEAKEAPEEPPYQICMHALKIGDVYLAGISGELYIQRAKLLQENSAKANTIVVNHDSFQTQVRSGYIIDDEYYLHMHDVSSEEVMPIIGEDNFIPGSERFNAMPGYIDKAMSDTWNKIINQLD